MLPTNLRTVTGLFTRGLMTSPFSNQNKGHDQIKIKSGFESVSHNKTKTYHDSIPYMILGPHETFQRLECASFAKINLRIFPAEIFFEVTFLGRRSTSYALFTKLKYNNKLEVLKKYIFYSCQTK